jgi:hypothetical protein
MGNPTSISMLCISVGLALAGCSSSSEPPSCSDSVVQSKAWGILSASFYPDSVALGYGNIRNNYDYNDTNEVYIPGTNLLAAIAWTMTSERTAKYDASIHKRWCQADISASYDVSKIDQSAITYPASDPNHAIADLQNSRPMSVSQALKLKFPVSLPSVFEYAVQRTDDGGMYVTLESAPSE